MKLEAHHRSFPKSGESTNGDAVVIRTVASATLVAVIDALGHGPSAAEAAAVAVGYLEGLDPPLDVRAITDELHRRMHGTRGAAAMICVLEAGRLTGCSVGNVEIRTLHDRIPVVSTPGILGSRMRNLRVFEAPVRPGERLILFTDGLSSALRASDAAPWSGLAACDALMRQHRRAHDDATVVILEVKA